MKRHLLLLFTSFLLALLLFGGLLWSHPSNAHAQGVCTSGYTELSEAPIKDVLGNHLGILAVCEKVVGSQALLEGVVKGDHIETEIDVTMTEVDVDPVEALGSDYCLN